MTDPQPPFQPHGVPPDLTYDARPEALRSLQRHLDHPGTIHAISAPPGFGKTTLLRRLETATADRHDIVALNARLGANNIAELTNGLHDHREQRSWWARLVKPDVQSVTVGVNAGVAKAEAKLGAHLAETELVDRLTALATHAAKHDRSAVIVIDDATHLTRDELAHITHAVTTVAHDGRPISAVLAGRPALAGDLAEAGADIARVRFQALGPFTPTATHTTLIQPLAELGYEINPRAASHLIEAAAGNPHMAHRLGATITTRIDPAWPLDTNYARAAVLSVHRDLQAGYWPAHWQRATPPERAVLAAVVARGQTFEFEAVIGRALNNPATVTEVVDGLVGAGVLTRDRGELAMTMPGLDRYLDRTMDLAPLRDTISAAALSPQHQAAPTLTPSHERRPTLQPPGIDL